MISTKRVTSVMLETANHQHKKMMFEVSIPKHGFGASA